MTVGERIKIFRTRLGMTQEELANLIGYKSRSSINKIEIGERDITQSTILSFANALKITPSELMGWSEKNDSFWDKLNYICKQNGTDIETVIKNAGIGENANNWKYGITPKYETLISVSKYLDIPVNTFLNQFDSFESKVSDVDQKTNELFKKRKVLFDKSEKATPEQLDTIIKLIDQLTNKEDSE